MTDITTNGHARMPKVEYGAFDQYNKNTPQPRDEVTQVIEGIRGIHEEQRVQLAERDNMIELLRDENIAMREERDFYLRKSVALAQQMKSISQLCEEGRRLAEAADRLEREASLKD